MSRSLKVAALVSLATLALLFAAMRQGRTIRAERLLHDVPGSARAVLRVDTRALEESAAAEALLAMLIPDEQLSEIEAVCGLDPRASLAEATAWVRGSEEQPFQSIGLMIRGRSVDAATLADCHRLLVEARGGSVVRIDSASGPILASRERGSAIAGLGTHSIVTGSVRTVAEAIAVHRGEAPSLAEGAKVSVLWPDVAAGSGLAAIVDPPAHWKSAVARVMGLGENAVLLNEVQTIALSASPGRAGTLTVHIRAVDPENAAEVSTVLRDWLASPPQRFDSAWAEMLQSARLSVRGQTIAVTVNVANLSAVR